MDYQVLFNITLGGCAFLGGFMLHAVWADLKDLKVADTKLAEKVASIETLVAGNYVTRDEFQNHMGALFRKLDSISDKIDRKADK